MRVLVIGAGGVFGSRLAEGLVDAGFAVVAAGRDLARAEATAARLRARRPNVRVEAVALDTRTLDAGTIRGVGADVVADCAGPFQGAEPRVARAAISAGVHYVDLADARDFVAAFPALDAEARAAGVVALGGCSSTPALSNAALDALTSGWREVVSVEAAISPGARAPRGPSVTRAILSWLGRPVRVFTSGEWRRRTGWGDLHRRDFGGAGPRWVSLCETPDLDLMVTRHRPREKALFLAGLEPGVLHWGGWMLARAACLTGLDMRPFAGVVGGASKLFAPFGSDRGAMRVTAYGVDGEGRAARAVWRLVADPGAGPVTPSLPALAAIQAIAAGRLEPGARACVGAVSLTDIEAAMAAHGLVTDRASERGAIFARALGEAFDILPAAIRALHETPGRSLWRGEARTWGAETRAGALVARLFGFPGGSEAAPAEVEMRADGERAVWRRRIDGHRFRSVLSQPRPGGRVIERFGPLSFELALSVEGERLVYRIIGWRLGPMPLPGVLRPRTDTFETVNEAGRFTFDVTIAAPLFGRLVRYRGWLERVG